MTLGIKAALAAAVVVALTASCKKGDDDNKGGSSGNGWVVNDTTYTTDTTYRIAASSTNNANGIAASTVRFTTTGQPLGHVYFYFPSAFPTANTTIRVGARGLQIFALTKGDYVSDTATTVDASIIVNSGKISITVPSVWLYDSNSNKPYNQRDSAKFSCTNFTEL